MSRARRYGSVNGMAFHLLTMMSEDVPMPSAQRPGAASASAAALCAISAGPRV